jgi:predicted enzyme related to lactoylglutathione lyase
MNRVVHFEIHAKDLDAMQKFYEGLFDWKFQAMGEAYGGYRVIVTGPGPDDMAKGVRMEDVGINGGMTARHGDPAALGAPVNGFVNIIGVEDTDAMMEKGVALGGTVALPAMDIPHVGRVGYLLDPDHNIFGVLTPDVSGMQS